MRLGELAVIIIRGTLKMAVLAPSAPAPPRSTTWFLEFLRDELTPYPERAALVARMVIAATIVMLITMTFRMPYGAYASLYALTISRESPQTTGTAVKSIVAAFVLGGVYVLISACFFFGDPLPRLLWVIGSLFASFYVISTMTNYGAAARFGYLIIITVPLWDQPDPDRVAGGRHALGGMGHNDCERGRRGGRVGVCSDEAGR